MLPRSIKEYFDTQAQQSSQQFGNETRKQILPEVSQSEVGWKSPNYDYSGELMAPDQVGVRSGDSLSDVVDAVKGMAYYSDMIGFGQSSTSLTSGFGPDKLRPLGVNYFMPTYQKCPNGEKMWMYVKGIPEGNVLGDRVKTAMERMGLPGLRGMAPGMLEDAETALNPVPIVQAVLGKPYPDCEEVTLPVGDSLGRLKESVEGGTVWIPEDQVVMKDGKPYQTHWVQKKDAKGDPVFIDYDEWSKSQPKSSEGFSSNNGSAITIGVALTMLAMAITFTTFRK
jgi:hypothetical protein